MALLAAFAAAAVWIAVTAIRRKKRAKRARELVRSGALLLDVRTAREFGGGHLPGAVNVPLDRLLSRPRQVGAMGRPVVVYCRSGARSARAARALKGAGFETVLDLGPMSAL